MNSVKSSTLEDLLMQIKKQHMRLYDLNSTDETVATVRKELVKYIDENGTHEGFDEHWEWKKRQSKLVTKCVKVFEMEGFEWRLPFWDPEVLEFWPSIPRCEKADRKLFYANADAILNGKYGCSFSGNPLLSGLFVSSATASGRNFSQFLRHKPVLMTRITGLFALDTCGKVFDVFGRRWGVIDVIGSKTIYVGLTIPMQLTEMMAQ